MITSSARPVTTTAIPVAMITSPIAAPPAGSAFSPAWRHPVSIVRQPARSSMHVESSRSYRG